MINYNHEFKTPLFWVNQGYLTSHMTFKSSKKKTEFRNKNTAQTFSK
jgi:hypothetical protein